MSLPSSMSGGSPPTNTLREYRSTRSPLRWGKQWAEPRPASPWSPDSSSPKERSSSMGNRDEWPIGEYHLDYTYWLIYTSLGFWKCINIQWEGNLIRRNYINVKKCIQKQPLGANFDDTIKKLLVLTLLGLGRQRGKAFTYCRKRSLNPDNIQGRTISDTGQPSRQTQRQTTKSSFQESLLLFTKNHTEEIKTHSHLYLVFCHNFLLHVKQHKTLLKWLFEEGAK